MTHATFGRRGAVAAPPPRRPAQPPQPAWTPSPKAAPKAALPSKDDSLFGYFLWLLFSFDGRLDRRTYRYVRIVANLGYLLAAWGLDVQILAAFGNEALQLTWALLGFGLSALMIYTTLAMQVKRRHDRDKAWGWVFLGFIPFAGPIWVLVECCWLEGTPGYNRFDDPDKSAAATFS
jgi:uncharacterized membrane protein YhaH (DUF805 family)